MGGADPRDLCDVLLAANASAFEAHHFEAAYHALASAMHWAADAGDCKGLEEIAARAQEQGVRLYALAPGSRMAQRRYDFFASLNRQALARTRNAERRELNPDRADAASPPTIGRRLAGLRVLVVDDSLDVRDLVKALLEENGARVEVAGDTYEARAAFYRVTPDVVVSDISHDGGDGYSMISSLRERNDRFAAIAFTGHDEPHRALQAGFNRHLLKPVSSEELITAITDVMNVH